MLEITTECAGAQTQFLPRPGAASFKRLLGSTLTKPSDGTENRQPETVVPSTKIVDLQRSDRIVPPPYDDTHYASSRRGTDGITNRFGGPDGAASLEVDAIAPAGTSVDGAEVIDLRSET